SYFACNDSNLFGQVHAWENLKKIPHKKLVACLAVLGAATAAWLSISGAAKSLEVIASLNCVIVPTPTIIMLAELLLATKILKTATNFSTRVTRLQDTPLVIWPGMIALITGILVGVATAGVIPGLEFFHFGICSVQSWLAAVAVYIPLRLMAHTRSAPEPSDLEHMLADSQPTPERVLID
ncbi:MAG TPA: hypothetical protein VKK81_08175, partial [Candidatus Binatia bacterium]|nr:hypothetical protein [Candidatus Binatia bacterium]